MSFTQKQRDNIKSYLLNQIDKKNKDYVHKTVEAYEISKATVYSYLKKMVEEGIIKKTENGFPYELISHAANFVYKPSDGLEEDIIFHRDIKGVLPDLPRNVMDIWRYSFTEMMNNAIEHSQAPLIACRVVTDKLNTKIIIGDNGIGIFNNIQKYFKDVLGQEITLNDAVAELFAGKLTTASSNHSGEGIFFTSRAVDYFFILSGNKVFSHTSYDDYIDELKENLVSDEGTWVLMKLSNTSPKNLQDIMFGYSDVDRGFYKTALPIVNMFEHGDPVSRSEARRLGAVIKRFEEVSLDFKNVEAVGQAFVHELFVVFKRNNPEIELKVENANTAVSNMIQRVLNSNNS